MKPSLPVLLSLACLFAGPALAQAPAKPAPAKSPCFRLSDLENHKIVDAHTLYYGVRGKEVYKFTMSGSCLAAAQDSDPLVLEPFSSTTICRPMDLNLGVMIGGGTQTCIIKSIEKLTPEQVAAIPKKFKP